MQTHNLGYPRIGGNRELKKACEQYWSGKTTQKNLVQVGKNLRQQNWQLQKEAGIDLVPSNDFSFYDQVLDMSLVVGAIPERYHRVIGQKDNNELDLYFAMARGYQREELDVTAMEMTKWFDTNYHYIVPEFKKNQPFTLFSNKVINEFYEAKQLGLLTKPVLIGPVSYLLLGKEKDASFHRIDLIENLLPVYLELIDKLVKQGAQWIQFDEPFLAIDLTKKEKEAFTYVYSTIKKNFRYLKTMVTTYFEGLRDNTELALSLPVCALHVDLVRCPEQLETLLDGIPQDLTLSLGIVDGRNIWKNDFQLSLSYISQAVEKLGSQRIMLAPSCSLLHVPCDLELETNEAVLTPEIKNWLAFAKQKVGEVVTLFRLSNPDTFTDANNHLKNNILAIESRRNSQLIHTKAVKAAVLAIAPGDDQRKNPFPARQSVQRLALQLPHFPTTTIGSFPQTEEVRLLRSKLKKGELSSPDYETQIKEEIGKAIRWQESIGLDVLVHGEFERNDMVEYFGEQLQGYAFSKNGWVQSYGSRCVKPPILFGDISRPTPMTVSWTAYAQSLTSQPVKGMLTGPITVLQWSFVRDDQPRSTTALQLALAIRQEVLDLERAGIRIIQIDEPAIREGLPLRKADWQHYLDWAVRSFRISASGVADTTQIHTHMCYSEFNDIIQNIADMDADVITIETSRSQMELLDAFATFQYPNEIGPGVYDIHSPRVPSRQEMVQLLNKAKEVIPVGNLWVNPDCGLKTRHWKETQEALKEMVDAARELRESVTETA